MLVLVMYDIAQETPQDQTRLRQVGKLCQDLGQRVQYSVFECLVEPAQWVSLKDRLIKTIQPERDSLRFYFLGKNYKRRVEHVGAKPSRDQEGPLIV